MNSLGFGITITVGGNFEPKLRQARRGIRDLEKGTKQLERAQNKARSVALKQAAALGLLGTLARRVGGTFQNLARRAVGFFANIAKAGGEFQHAMLGLKVFFGDDAETVAGAVLQIANASDVALDDVTNIARRLGGIGLPAQDAARAVRILTQGISTLAGQARTRAIQGIANILERADAATRLLDTSFTALEKSQISAVKGTARQLKILELLEKRFGTVNLIMKEGFLFGIRQLIQLIPVFFAKISLPALKKLTFYLARIVDKFNQMIEGADKGTSVIKPLQKIFSDLVEPFRKLLKFMHEANIVPRFFQFLADHPRLVKSLALMGTVGAAGLGALLTTVGSLAIVAASLKLMKAAELGSLFSGLGKLGGIGDIFTKKRKFPAMADLVTQFKEFFGMGKKVTEVQLDLFKPLKKGIPVLSKLGSLFGSIGTGILVALGALISLAAIGGILFGLFKSAAGPTLDFFKGIVRGAVMLAQGFMQVATTGKLSEALLNRLTDTGLLPLFRGLLLIFFRLKAIFLGFAKPLSELGADFKLHFQAIKFAFVEISSAIMSLLQDLGLMERGSTKGLTSFAYGLGWVLKWLIRITLFLTTSFIVAFGTAFKMIVGAVQIIIGLFKFMVALFTGGPMSQIFEFFAALVTGDFKGAYNVIKAGPRMYNADDFAGAWETTKSGASNLTGQPSEKAGSGQEDDRTWVAKLFFDRKQVAQASNKSNKETAQQFSD